MYIVKKYGSDDSVRDKKLGFHILETTFKPIRDGKRWGKVGEYSCEVNGNQYRKRYNYMDDGIIPIPTCD